MKNEGNQKATEVTKFLRQRGTFLKESQYKATLSMLLADQQGLLSFHLGKVDIPVGQVLLRSKISKKPRKSSPSEITTVLSWFRIEETACTGSNSLLSLRIEQKKKPTCSHEKPQGKNPQFKFYKLQCIKNKNS